MCISWDGAAALKRQWRGQAPARALQEAALKDFSLSLLLRAVY